LKEAFAWSQETVPPQFKPWSISFLLALQVILLGAASLAAAVLFLGLALSGESKAWMWIIAILVALIYFFDLLAVYWWLLREDEKE
jgi:phosphotransferase system  glucose/maltose/N-acetylglucosamine-specific IIC component